MLNRKTIKYIYIKNRIWYTIIMEPMSHIEYIAFAVLIRVCIKIQTDYE